MTINVHQHTEAFYSKKRVEDTWIYTLDYDVFNLETKYSTPILTFKYDGVVYHKYCLYRDKELQSKEELDLSKFEFVNIVVVKSNYSSSMSWRGIGQGLIYLGEILLIICGIAFGLGAFIIAPAIVIPNIVKRAKRRRQD